MTSSQLAKLSTNAVQSALAGVATGPAPADVVETIDRWRGTGAIMGDREDLTRLYLALRQANTTGQGRITPQLLTQWKGQVRFAVKLTRTFHLVDREKKPNLPNDARVREFLVSASQLEQFPQHVDPDAVWIVDAGAPRELLGPGVVTLDLQLSDTRTAPGIPGPSQILGAERPRPEMAPVAQPPVQEAAATDDKKKILGRKDSDTEEEAALALMSALVKALEAGRVSVLDKSQPDTAEFCYNTWLQHMDVSREASAEISLADFYGSLHPLTRDFPRYVVLNLLKFPLWPSVHALVPPMEKTKSKWGELLPIVGKAILEMHACNTQNTPFDMYKVGGMQMKHFNTLYLSSFYKSYLNEIAAEKYEALIQQKTSLQSKLSTISTLLETCTDEHRRKSLEFAKVYATLRGPPLCRFLMEDLGTRLDLLSLWDSGAAFHCLSLFADVSMKWKNVNVWQFLHAFCMVAENGCEDLVANPSVKALFKDWVVFKDLQCDNEDWQVVVDLMFAELCCARLGCQVDQDVIFEESELALMGFGDKAERLCIIAVDLTRKVRGAQKCPMIAKFAAMPAPETVGSQPAQEAGHKKSVVTVTGAATPMDAKAEPQPAAASSFTVGDKVLTLAKKKEDKPKFDNQQGHVTILGKRKATVKIDSGPAVGEEREFAYQMLQPLPGTNSASPLAAPAGGGSALASGESEEQKKKRKEDTAQKLFGNVSDL